MISQYEIFFLSPFGCGASAEEMNHFLRSHRVLHIEKKTVDSERGTGWMMLVEYISGEFSEAKSPSPKVDYQERLSQEEFVIFNKLRDVRKQLAEKNGVPVYAVASNEHIFQMIKGKFSSIKDLEALQGMGGARIKQFGDELIACLTKALPPSGTAKENETETGGEAVF